MSAGTKFLDSCVFFLSSLSLPFPLFLFFFFFFLFSVRMLGIRRRSEDAVAD